MVDQLTEHGHDAAVYHKTVHRPWGEYSVLDEQPDCKVRRLRVKPGQVLSLQMHQKRSEQWTVLSGSAKARIGDKEMPLGAGDTVVIEPGTPHRLENTGPSDLHIVEVQLGEYIGADDIVRYEDVYGTSESRS